MFAKLFKRKAKKSKTLARMEAGIDLPFMIITVLLIGAGLIIFSSAILMLIGTVKYDAVRFNQYGLGFIGGIVLAYAAYKIPLMYWRMGSFYMYIASVVAMILVFVPGIGVFHGGAHRWIQMFGFQFQPAEVYKISSVLYMAMLLTKDFGKKIVSKENFQRRTLPLIYLIAISAVLFLLQPDTDTLVVTVVALVAVYILSGGHMKDMFALGGVGIIGLGIIIISRPYALQRVQTFINPSSDPTGSGYQVQQSLIAIGTGGVFGRGYGQSIQKFKYLPEPIGDSIFAVASEEFGFIGMVFLIGLYVAFTLRALKVASRSSSYGSLVIVGLMVLIVVQSFLNMSAMLGVTPLSGTPLIFVSQGGTALLMSLFSIGIILSASREKKVGVR
jgi:cell division protein FtsW